MTKFTLPDATARRLGAQPDAATLADRGKQRSLSLAGAGDAIGIFATLAGAAIDDTDPARLTGAVGTGARTTVGKLPTIMTRIAALPGGRGDERLEQESFQVE